jgi:hypothetical protein
LASFAENLEIGFMNHKNAFLISIIVHLILGLLLLLLLPPSGRNKSSGPGKNTTYLVHLKPFSRHSRGNSLSDRIQKSASSGIAIKKKSLKHLGVPLFSPRSINSEPNLINLFRAHESSSDFFDPFSPEVAFSTRFFQTLGNSWRATLLRKLTLLYQQNYSFPAGSSREVQADIYIDPEGNIIRLTLGDVSGVKEIDDSVTEAISDRLRFPNPPRHLFRNVKSIKIPVRFIVNF